MSAALQRNLFLRLLGIMFLAAFLSLYAQATLLWGDAGLLPARSYLAATGWLRRPSLFRFACNDTLLSAAALLGSGLSLVLTAGVAPRYVLLALWLLYLSFANLGQAFLSFQWDNLILETAFFSLFVTPRGLRLAGSAPPTPALGVFLMRWLLFRLHFESGAAKLLLGDPTWRDLTALASYYETAPLPTWLGWYAHQLPLWAHRISGGFTYLVELILPFLIWGPRRVRPLVFLLMLGFELSIIATANYGFFNYLTIALCLWVLDDDHLRWVASRLGWSPRQSLSLRPSKPLSTVLLAAVVTILVALTFVPFLPFVRSLRFVPAGLRDWPRVASALDPFRSINAYHLFAQMTLVRREPVIEGSNDGLTWVAYEFRYKPGDPNRPPPFVAPHQPRVDFQLWFLLLGGRSGAPYFDTLLSRLLHEPAVVRPLFANDPFPDAPPKYVRVVVYRYRFTDFATRRQTGAWWSREREGTSRTLSAAGAQGGS